MRKLIHKKEFVHLAGSTWRLLLVHAIFPWLSKYRILTRPEKTEENKAIKDEKLSRSTVVDLSKSFALLRKSYAAADTPKNLTRTISEELELNRMIEELEKELADLKAMQKGNVFTVMEER